jgi:hypothetical protein
MSKHRRFDLGDEVVLQGVVRLIDAGGPGSVTIEVQATGQRITIDEGSAFVALVAKAKPETAFAKAPKGRQGLLVTANPGPDRRKRALREGTAYNHPK